jgi:hypothetical protein
LASKELDRLLALLPTFEHGKAMSLYDSLIRDPSNAGPILQGLLFVVSNHHDPQLHTPHGLLTVVSARELLHLTHPPGGLSLLRFLVLYNFTLQKRRLTVAVADTAARAVPTTALTELSAAYRKAVGVGLGDQAAGLLGRIALDVGVGAAAHVALRTALNDFGRLGHNLVVATAYSQTAEALGPPKALISLSNLARLQALSLVNVPVAIIPDQDGPGEGEPDVSLLEELVVEGSFDRVEAVLRSLAQNGQADEAYRPLLIAASADPGFLGHTLSLVHSARIASRYLTPSENAWLSWKLYRTLATRFGYPEFLELGGTSSLDRDSVLVALESSLRYKSPPAETTVRQALEAGVPLEEILAHVVDFYGNWTVGEKEHTISYLNAALQTAKFLGKDRALLPLAIALSKLPF